MKNKVYFFNKKIDCIINSIFIIIIIILGAFCWGKFDFIKGKAENIFNYDFSDLEVGVLLIFIEILIVGGVSLVGKFLKRHINSSSFIKHTLYSKIRPILLNVKNTFSRIVGNKSLNVFYYINYKPTPQQKEISKHIINILSPKELSDQNNVLWIQGSTFSGKTMTISHILINLISRSDSYQIFNRFNNRISYIDFFKDNYKKFIDDYEKQKYTKSILIIDNTYALPEKVLQELVEKIYKATLAKIIIVCMRDFSEISNDPYFINKLEEKMIGVGKVLYMPQICEKASYLSKRVIDEKHKINTFEQLDLSTQFHYVNMCERNKENHTKILEDIADYLNHRISQDNLKHKVIFIISCFSIFTGSFTKKQLSEYFTEFKNKLILDLILSELHSCGFVDRSPYGFGETYIFNSEIAKCYFSIGYKSKHLIDTAHVIIKQQFESYLKSENQLAFLYGCLMEDKSKKSTEIFDSIVTNTNFRLLLNEMDFLESVEKNIAVSYKREIGILCDRTGEFLKSRKKFRELLDDCIEKNDINLALETFYRLVQIDHTEYVNHNKLKEYHSNHPYLQLQKRYWKLHIDMHKGKFSFADFLELLSDTQILTEKNCYDYLHLARRIYFDVYRLYYLEGINSTKELVRIKEKGIKVEEYLNEYLTEFNLYYKKFTTQFILCFDLIYNLAVYEDMIDEETYREFIECLNIDYSSMSDKIQLLERTISLCEELEAGFDSIGDKTFNFIRYYRTSLLIIKNDPSVKSLIKQYRDFGTHEIEYKLYAEFIELKYRIGQLLEVKNIDSYTEKEYEILRKNVYEQLDVVKKFFTGNYLNEYAVMRLKIYELLLSIIDQKGIPQQLLDSALSLAYKNNYKREIRLLEKIKERFLNDKLSFAWIRIVLLYYPIVPQ